MTFTINCEIGSAVSLIARWITAWLIAGHVLIATPVAWADCPTGSECYTAREAQVCLVCLEEREQLRALSKAKESERNAAVAMQNMLAGQLEECRLERERWQERAIKAEKRPGWLWVITIGAGALVFGGVAGMAL